MALSDSLKSRTSQWALRIQMQLAGAFTLTINAGTANSKDFWPTVGAESGGFPSLLSVGELLEELAGGVRPSLRFSLRNAIISTSAGPMEITDALRGRGVIGARVMYGYLFKGDNGVIEDITLFVGTVYSFEITQQAVTFRAADDDYEKVQIPVRTVAPNALLYGTREGTMPPEMAGSVVPIAYGRFNLDALDRTWASAFPWNGETITPAMHGIKHPMLPLVLMSDLYNYKETGGSPLTRAKYMLYAFGDTDEGANNTEIALYSAGTSDFFVPSYTNTVNSSTEDLEFKYTQLFTWDDETDQACPFVKDFSDHMDSVPSGKVPEKPYGCVWYPGKPSGHTGSGNTSPNRLFQSFACERVSSDWQGLEPEWWSGRTQSIALVPEKLSEYHGTTDTIVFGTTVGTTNPQACMDRVLSTFTAISGTNRLSLQMQAQGPRLGEVIAVRICIMTTNSLNQTCADIRTAFRFHPQAGGVLANPTCEYNCAQVGGTAVVQHVPGVGSKFFSFYIWRLPLLAADMQFGHGPPQWEFIENSAAPVQRFAGDLVIWAHDSNEAKIYSVWMEPIFRNNLSAMATREKMGHYLQRSRPTQSQLERGPLPRPPIGGSVVRQVGAGTVWRYPYNGNLPDPKLQPAAPQRVFKTGICVPFRASGSRWKPGYTPATSDPVENPLSIALHGIDKYLSNYSACEIAASTFGSFRDAIAYLEAIGTAPSWRSTVYQPERIMMGEWHEALGLHCRTQIVRQRKADGSHVWRAFVNCNDPAASFPANRWRSGNETLSIHDIYPENIIVDHSARDELRSRFVMRYGFHEPTGKYAYERMCNKDVTNLATQAALYTTACAATEIRYRDPVALIALTVEEVQEYPWIWMHDVADDMLKFIINTRRDRRVVVSFTGGANLLDIHPGHVVYLNDNFADVVGNWPGLYTPSTWSGHQMVVTSRNIGWTRRGVEVELVLVEPYALPT